MVVPSIFGANILFSTHWIKTKAAATITALIGLSTKAKTTAGINPKAGPIYGIISAIHVIIPIISA